MPFVLCAARFLLLRSLRFRGPWVPIPLSLSVDSSPRVLGQQGRENPPHDTWVGSPARAPQPPAGGPAQATVDQKSKNGPPSPTVGPARAREPPAQGPARAPGDQKEKREFSGPPSPTGTARAREPTKSKSKKKTKNKMVDLTLFCAGNGATGGSCASTPFRCFWSVFTLTVVQRLRA